MDALAFFLVSCRGVSCVADVLVFVALFCIFFVCFKVLLLDVMADDEQTVLIVVGPNQADVSWMCVSSPKY
jgi:hypothetical protein